MAGPTVKNKLQKLLAGLSAAYPSASSPYWRALPLRRMKSLLAGVFLLGSVFGFAVNLLQPNGPRLAFLSPLFFGGAVTSILVVRIKKASLLPLLFLVVIGLGWLTERPSGVSAPLPVQETAKRRVWFDVVGIWVGVSVGFRLLLYFVTTEGLANVRMQTEFSLARDIQADLVPAVSFQTESFEAYGESSPSTEMGGDLIDVIQSDGSLLAYVADISGHGLAAGQLMGMLKTAMRVSMQFHREPKALLESADRVLPAVKRPDMFATLALLYFDGSLQVEYALAGHLPILHYRNGSRDTVKLAMQQFPLGLLPGGCYASARVSYSLGDLFLMLTDGISETTNDKDEEFGMERVKKLLTANAKKPLPEIWQLVMDDVSRHGAQQDDRTLLLVRVLSLPLRQRSE